MEDRNDQMEIRLAKLNKLREQGPEPYPYTYNVTHATGVFLSSFNDLVASGTKVALAGRLVAKRVMGKASFCHIEDREGRVQVFVQGEALTEGQYPLFKEADLGDWVGFEGTAFTTKTGESSLKASSFTLLAKCLRPLPSLKEAEGTTFSAFADTESRYRHRYIDLIVNRHSREVFIKRTRIVGAIRKFLDERHFLEVETPTLQPIYGGASARPFVTHHNTLGTDLFLRISDELYLKRLIVGGLERVYEIAHNYRNEGIDRNHNPEFTSMEFYIAYMDYLAGMDLVEELYRGLAQAASGTLQLTWGDKIIDFEKPFRRATMQSLIQEAAGIDILKASDKELLAACQRLGADVAPPLNYGRLVDALFSAAVEPNLIQPTFVIDYPKLISPLAKRHRSGGDLLVERFELYIAGMEFGNAFSELNDPVDQRSRLEHQAQLKAEGDDEASPVDDDFIMALEYGMPPTFGFGMGVDRFVMLATNSPNIRDVILFPTLKPVEKSVPPKAKENQGE